MVPSGIQRCLVVILLHDNDLAWLLNTPNVCDKPIFMISLDISMLSKVNGLI